MNEQTEKVMIQRLDKALKNENLNPLKYEFPETEIKGGYIAKLERVQVIVEKQGTKKTLDIIVKNAPTSTFTDACLNEVNFYSEIIPCFNKFAEEKKAEKFSNLPMCYGISTSDEHVMVVLENLIPKGFKIRDFEPFDTDHLKLLIESFAKYHAFSFALNDQKPDIFRQLGKRNVKLEDWKILDMTISCFEEQMDNLVGVYERKNKPEVLNKLKALRKNCRDNTKAFLRNEDEKYVVVTHADAWISNFLFKYNEESHPIDVKIVDWQTAIVGSPLIDIVQLLFFCCLRNELEYIDDYLSFYHNNVSNKIRELGSNPEKCFPREACWKSFKRYAPLGIAGVPFLLKMYHNGRGVNDADDAAEIEKGNFSAFLGDDSDFEATFESANDILELCIERDLI